MAAELIHEGPRFRVTHYPRSRITIVDDQENAMRIYHAADAEAVARAVRDLREALKNGDPEVLQVARAEQYLAREIEALPADSPLATIVHV